LAWAELPMEGCHAGVGATDLTAPPQPKQELPLSRQDQLLPCWGRLAGRSGPYWLFSAIPSTIT
jgi:hypothetical protein